ncbi:putative carboxymuconolactone decarboxylase protein [Streptomyces lincolnensis]|uniref:Putative carboxymuconolactone decarboxylase protein n=1 Tax=Streptomyces lincolnensis TaxID=1915 RepID=A0A1B1MMA4_STRLN|nr:carboxymuconolactone decarboxylase family protein [Streptomyces lincolnensis]ANS69708.1 putative carboxymuconolactone decarboxylase protein [Streptomyces lincolnensis]AXG58627.1 putative carboxymuconolactone decarboxylase protein [Streptomyces lincolnensis]QMV11254.1 carboxymuconolactone decarboxylase family protein [Streptomyces lincolnensis]
MTRVPYLRREDAKESHKPLYDRLEAERKVPTANIFLALANAPAQLDAFLTYANSLRAADLSPKLRELAILTVGHATRSSYEVAHHQSHGLKAGLTEEQLAAVADFESSHLFDSTEKAIMRLAKESTLQVEVSQETWRAAAAYLTDRQMVELSLSIAWYNSGVRIMGLLDIDLEDNYPNPFPNS